MAEITFLRSVHVYDSYGDLFRLAELAGFPIQSVSDLDVSKPGVYVTAPMNGDWRAHIDAQADRVRNAHLILWQLERPSGSAGSVGKYGESNRKLMYGLRDDGSPAPARYADEVWVSDRQLARETTLRYVPLGSHPGFGEQGDEKGKRWQFTHQSYEIPRRQTIHSAFAPSMIGPNAWGDKRDEVLRRSKFGLAMHQDTYPFLEPLRMAVFAAYGLPTLVETVMDAYPYGDETAAFAPYDHLVPKMKAMIDGDYRPWRDMGRRMRKLMTEEFEFGKVVREAVAQSVGDWR